MRLSVFLILLTGLQSIAGNSYAQSQKFELKMENVSITEVLDEIEEASNFFFFYNNKVVSLDKHVSLELHGKSITEVLDVLFTDTDVDYHINNRQIILSAKESVTLQPGQKVVIKGKVTDSSGATLPGVTIVVKGTQTGTITDIDGNYLINANVGDVLQFSFVGMKTTEQLVGDQTTIDLTLKADAIGLEEVVAIGYGYVKKSDLTGSVTSIATEQIAESSNTMVQALQGKAAGVMVSTGSGAPGGGINIRIRGTSTITGSTEPLYIIDGFPVNSDNDDAYIGGGTFEGSGNVKVRPNALNIINPNDIESIEILKDASATAIYGSRGANGVVLITTKRGKSGAPKLNVNYSYGLQKVIRKFDVLTGPEYAERYNAARNAGGEQDWYDGSTFYRPLPQNAATVNWQDEMYRVAPQQILSISVNGGNANSKYLVSGKVSNQEGIMINSGYKDAQFRMNLDTKISDFISIGANVAVNHSNNQLTTTGATVGINMVDLTLGTRPTFEIDWMNETGQWWVNPEENFQTSNPVKYSEEIKDYLVTNRLMGNAFVDINFTPELKFHGSAGIDHSDGERNIYYPRTIMFHSNYYPGGRGRINRKIIERKMVNGYFSWDKEFGSHKISATMGSEIQNQTISRRDMQAENFTSDNLTTNNLGEGLENIRLSSYQDEWQSVGFFGRVNYNFNSKYLLTANFRYDGSSRFGADNKWAFFPSVAGAWRATEEDFMKTQGIFTDLKVRASVGQTGNGDIPVYSSLGTWSINGNRYSINDVLGAGATLSRLANPELKWETTTQYNIGLDLGFLNNKLGINLDYYITSVLLKLGRY